MKKTEPAAATEPFVALFDVDLERFQGVGGVFGVNTKLTYRYDLARDGRTYPGQVAEVVHGAMSLDDMRRIAAALNGGRKFVPELLDMACLNQTPENDDYDPALDGPWHELVRIELTLDEPTGDIVADDLVMAFEDAAQRGWPVDECCQLDEEEPGHAPGM